MAVIGYRTGVALVPGVSKNGRLYTPEHVDQTVADWNERIASPGGLPVTMKTHHGAGDDSRQLTGRVVQAWKTAEGAMKYRTSIIDTDAGRNIWAATEKDTDGGRTLDAVSIYGAWTSPVQTMTHEGRQVTTARTIHVDRIDWTDNPGVPAARLDPDDVTGESATPSGWTPLSEEAPPEVVTPPPMPAELLQAHAAAEAYMRLTGWAGPADVSVDAFVPNDDVPATADQVVQAFTAAIAVLDPKDEDGDTEPLVVLASAPETPGAVGEHRPAPAHPATETVSPGLTPENGAPVPDENTTETTGTTENTQVTALTEARVGELIDAAFERFTARLAPAQTENTTTTETTPGGAVSAPITETAVETMVTKALGAELPRLTEALGKTVGETVDGLRKGIVKAYGPPPRTGLVETAEKAAEAKPLEEQSPEERNATYEAAFAHVLPARRAA